MWMKNMEHEIEVHRVYRLRLNIESQFWQKLFNYGCSKLIIRKIFDETTRNCLECQVDHPSQTRHDCLYITLSEQIGMYFDDVYNQTSKEDVQQWISTKNHTFHYPKTIDDWMHEVEKDYETILKKTKKMMRRYR